MITEEYIRKTINRCYPQEGLCLVPRKALDYSREIPGGWSVIRGILSQWENLGYIKILNNVESASDNDICIEILKFLDGKDFPPNWIRDRPEL